MKRDRDGSTAIDPLCIGTVIAKPAAAAATPFGDNKSAVLVIVDDFGLSPVECHWSTILLEFLAPNEIELAAAKQVSLGARQMARFECQFTRIAQKIVLFLQLLSSESESINHAKCNSIKTLA